MLLELLSEDANFTLEHIDLDENHDLDDALAEEIGALLVRNRGGSLFLRRY